GTVQSLDGDACTVQLTSGHRVTALAVSAGGIGSPTRLSIRPERVILAPKQDNDVNRLSARVAEIIYSGDHHVLRMVLPGELMLVAKAPLTPEVERLAPGDTVEVGWNYAHCRALAPERAPGGLREDT
ncbi:MAG: TOBE domain-containing protein, partial [Gammaproteobacteria bacterium]